MFRFITTLICPFLLACSIASAQISSATLVGTVTDASGRRVAGAAVEARNPAHPEHSRTATTGCQWRVRHLANFPPRTTP